MAVWAKIRMYYKTMLGSSGSSISATSTAAGDYSINYIYNWLETNFWKSANTTTPMYISYDAGSGNTKTADYLAIIGHNLKTCGATIGLQYSSDDTTYYDCFTAFAVIDDKVILKEFTSPGVYQYWRLAITGTLSVVPFIAICVWGDKTELDYATASFDPHEQNIKANIGLSQGGYVTGVHISYVTRELDLKFNDSDSTFYDKIKAWWDNHGIKNFFIAWDITNNPTEVYLMRAKEKISNPFNQTGIMRDINLSLTGRKE